MFYVNYKKYLVFLYFVCLRIFIISAIRRKGGTIMIPIMIQFSSSRWRLNYSADNSAVLARPCSSLFSPSWWENRRRIGEIQMDKISVDLTGLSAEEILKINSVLERNEKVRRQESQRCREIKFATFSSKKDFQRISRSVFHDCATICIKDKNILMKIENKIRSFVKIFRFTSISFFHIRNFRSTGDWFNTLKKPRETDNSIGGSKSSLWSGGLSSSIPNSNYQFNKTFPVRPVAGPIPTPRASPRTNPPSQNNSSSSIIGRIRGLEVKRKNYFKPQERTDFARERPKSEPYKLNGFTKEEVDSRFFLMGNLLYTDSIRALMNSRHSWVLLDQHGRLLKTTRRIRLTSLVSRVSSFALTIRPLSRDHRHPAWKTRRRSVQLHSDDSGMPQDTPLETGSGKPGII